MTITIEELEHAASHFPKVSIVCWSCHGKGSVKCHKRVQHGPGFLKKTVEFNSTCEQCKGTGRLVRDMEKREEHYYLMHLLTQ